MTVTEGPWLDSSVQAVETTRRVAVENASAAFLAVAHRQPSLNELTDEAVLLASKLEAVDDPEQVAAIEANIVLIDQMLIEKTESYIHVIREFEHIAAERKRDADRMAMRAKTAERHAEWLKARLLTNLKVAGRTRVEMARYTLSVVQNPRSVVVVDASAVPHEFERTRIEVSVDKRAILRHLEASGEVVPGIEVVRTERLQIS